MRRVPVIVSVGVCILGLVLGVRWVWRHDPVRSWRIVQRQSLVDGIIMQIDDLTIGTYPENHQTVLGVNCSYLGGDPSQDYFLYASIHQLGETKEVGLGNATQFWLESLTPEKAVKVWEGPLPPPSAEDVVLGMRLRAKRGEPNQPEKYVEFTIPNLPRRIGHP